MTSIFELHADRRRAGVPTISVLRGAPSSSIAEFRRWTTLDGLEPGVVLIDDDVELVSAWTATLGSHPTLRARAIEAIAAGARTSVESVRALADSHSTDAQALFRRASAHGPTEAFACAVLGRGDAASDNPVAAAARLLGETRPQPALLAIARHHSDRVASQVRHLVRVIEEAPSLVVALAITSEAYARLTAPPRTRMKAMLREGLFDVQPASGQPPRVGDPGLPPRAPTVTAAERELRAEAMPESVIDALSEVTALAPSTKVGQARSAYEHFLFEMLEHQPETAGLFELNGKLHFKFGPRPAEVDLVSRRLGIAIEIDGYFHFSGGANAFRRDRRKDVLLQQHGYIISRWLTQDVCERPHEVMNTIRELVQWRRHDNGEQHE